jgi:hypothetical protein
MTPEEALRQIIDYESPQLQGPDAIAEIVAIAREGSEGGMARCACGDVALKAWHDQHLSPVVIEGWVHRPYRPCYHEMEWGQP